MLGEVKAVGARSVRRGSRWLSILCALFSSATSYAQLDIVVTNVNLTPLPVAVVPFGWQGTGAPYDMAGVIAKDLRSSGRFAPIPITNLVSRPTEPSQVNFQDWRVLRVDALVIGQLSEAGPGMYTAVFQLFDVQRGEQLLAFRVTVPQADLRVTSHRIADMIFEKLTGIKGVFNTRISYVSQERNADGTARYKLILSDADGENSSEIASSTQPLMSPAWSPDGRRLAYVSFEGNASAVFVQTLRTGTREKVSGRVGVNGSPAFSPDGRRLTLTLSQDQGNLDVYTLDLASQVLRQLTTGDAIETEAAWAPDGRMIYFMSDRAGGPQIYRISSEPGGRIERVSREGAYNARPRVSPDGKQVAVVYGQNNTYRIGVIDTQSGDLQILTNGKLDESPSFAPNGAQIIYATREGTRGVLASVSTDGRIRQAIASVAGDVREPVWGPYPLP